jgi:hypothetical protein
MNEEDSGDERMSNMTEAFYQEEDDNRRFHRVYNL